MQGDGFWQGCREIVQCGWDCRMMHIYVKSINVSQKMKTRTAHERTIPVLGIFPKELKSASGRDFSIPMLTAALFTTAKIWKQSNCPSASEWTKKLLSEHTIGYYSPFQKREVLFTNFYASVHCLLCTPYSRFHVVFSCIEQLKLHATNSDKFSVHFYCYKCLQISLVMES